MFIKNYTLFWNLQNLEHKETAWYHEIGVSSTTFLSRCPAPVSISRNSFHKQFFISFYIQGIVLFNTRNKNEYDGSCQVH